MPLLIPLPWLLELTPKLFTNLGQLFVSLKMVKLEAMPKLSVANWTEVYRSRICIFQTVAPIHDAFIVNAVKETKAMAELMHRYFASAHSKLIIVFFLLGEIRELSMDA